MNKVNVTTNFSPLPMADYLAGHKLQPVKGSKTGCLKLLESAEDLISLTRIMR